MKIIWSLQAKESLFEIYLYHKQFSESGAKKLRKRLLNAPKTLIFSKQYQLDDINPKYRRIVVSDYKILYNEVNGELWMLDIVCSLQSPDILKSK
jgi:plasmid stabilization system protein ParE